MTYKLTKKDQLDRERIKRLGVGEEINVGWLKSLPKATRRMIDRKLLRHNLSLVGTEMDDIYIIAKEVTTMDKPKQDKPKEEKQEKQVEEKKERRYYESPNAPAPSSNPERRYYESGKEK